MKPILAALGTPELIIMLGIPVLFVFAYLVFKGILIIIAKIKE